MGSKTGQACCRCASQPKERLAEAVKSNPQSLRVSAQAGNGVTIIERPDLRRPQSTVVVIEVDAEGRPRLVKQLNPETNTVGVVEYKGGYGLPTPKKPGELSEHERLSGLGAQHEYNPLDALERE